MVEPRIVSLIASATEIVAALGLGRFLVGRSHECDYPPDVLALPACSEPKIDVHGTSREIDERVKSLAGEAISVYRVFPDLLRRLEPTHIITQTQCEVCAVSLRDVEAAMAQLIGQHPQDRRAGSDVSGRRLGRHPDRQPIAGSRRAGRRPCAAAPRRARVHFRPSGAVESPSVDRLSRMDRSVDVCRKLGPRARRNRRRQKPARNCRQAFSLAHVGRAGRV